MLSVLSSCFKEESFPVEPIISDPSITDYGDSIVVSFRFTDGDANVGLNPEDTTGEFALCAPNQPYYHNVYLDYYEKDDVNGWERGLNVDGDTVSFEYRIKRIEIPAKKEGIKGSMDVTVKQYYNPLSSESDTIKFAIRLMDRDFNISNTIETQEFHVP